MPVVVMLVLLGTCIVHSGYIFAQSIDDGSPTCEGAVTIPSCPFVDEGTLDGDNDCSAPAVAPYNEVFYRFAPATSGDFQFRLRISDGATPSLRILRGSCCEGGIQTAYAATTVDTDCGEGTATTYLRHSLTAGNVYFFHIGTAASTTSMSSYEFEISCVQCPRDESPVPHSTCQTAEEIALNDSLIGDSSNSSNEDWYRLVLSEPKRVTVYVGGREFGHCISGSYPTMPSVDARFNFHFGDCFNAIYSLDDEGCSSDARLTFNCIAPGIYYIRVYCYGSQPYILKVTGEEAESCPLVELPNQHCIGPCVGPILDTQTQSYPIHVTDAEEVLDLNVRLTISHSRDNNVIMRLVTPWADTLDLSRQNGGTGQHYIQTVFDDEAALSITEGTAPFTGNFRPQESLSAVNGHSAAGTWKFVVTDRGRTHQGYVECVCLEFDYDVILNVNLTSFYAVQMNDRIDLHWVTASETNNEAFEVERGGVVVSRMSGAGTIASESRYSWTDFNVTSGAQYEYTLYSVDIVGVRAALGTLSASHRQEGTIVSDYALYQNYPNPFNPETSLEFDIPVASWVTLNVYDPTGRLVREVVNGQMNAGRHVKSFDASMLPSGIYLYHLDSGGFSDAKKMVLIK